MNTRTATIIFKGLRATEILIVFICFILEIVEYAAFSEFYANQGIPLSAYFNAGITKSTKDESVVYYNGTKVYYYIVLILTLIDGGIYLSRSCYQFTGPFRRDISINAFFMVLWLSSGITNIYPSFKGYGYTCDNINTFITGDEHTDSVTPGAMARECSAKVMNISFGWINGFLFFLTTLIALKLWKERQERYEGERRVEALGEVVYKYKPRPNTIVRVDEPEKVMIFSDSKSRRKTQTPTYVIKTSRMSN